MQSNVIRVSTPRDLPNQTLAEGTCKVGLEAVESLKVSQERLLKKWLQRVWVPRSHWHS